MAKQTPEQKIQAKAQAEATKKMASDIKYKRGKILDYVKRVRKLYDKLTKTINGVRNQALYDQLMQVRTKFRDEINLLLTELRVMKDFAGKEYQTLEAEVTNPATGYLISSEAALKLIEDYLRRIVDIWTRINLEINNAKATAKTQSKVDAVQQKTIVQKEKIEQKAEITALKQQYGLPTGSFLDKFKGVTSGFGTMILVAGIAVGGFFLWKKFGPAIKGKLAQGKAPAKAPAKA